MTRSTARSTAKKTTSSRPSLAPKVTRKTEQKREQGLDVGFRIHIVGEVYEVRIRDIPNRLVAEMRAQTGSTPLTVFRLLQNGVMDIDIIAQFVWLARRMAGEEVGFDEVELTYGDMDDFDFTDLEGEAPTPDPET